MKKTYVALTLCIAMLTTGCGAAAKPVATETDMARNVSSDTPDITVEQVINEYNSARRAVSAEAAENDMYAPLSVMSCVCRAGESYIVFPKVEGQAGDIINSAICSAVISRAERLGIPVFTDYRVEYNRNGIFSIRMFLYDMYGEQESCIDCLPLTFNGLTGEICRISDFFDSEDQNWRGRIPDIITAQAADYEMVLLSDVLPISDDRPFYITDEAVVIMYDLYEISTYSAGEPEFEIPVNDIAECLDESSMLNAMLPQSREATEPVNDAEPSHLQNTQDTELTNQSESEQMKQPEQETESQSGEQTDALPDEQTDEQEPTAEREKVQ